jgi:hypothetical protein
MEGFIGGLEISALRGREDTKRCDDVQRRIPATFIDDGLPNRYSLSTRSSPRGLTSIRAYLFGRNQRNGRATNVAVGHPV